MSFQLEVHAAAQSRTPLQPVLKQAQGGLDSTPAGRVCVLPQRHSR